MKLLLLESQNSSGSTGGYNMENVDYDLIIVGGGPGGYVAAVRAAQLNAKVCLIERERMGGTCLNTGCIPTKALYRSAEVCHLLRNSEEFGVACRETFVNWEQVQNRKAKNCKPN